MGQSHEGAMMRGVEGIEKPARAEPSKSTEIQKERFDLAARELAEVSDRLHAAANALRASI
jgi:hypothetical protein